MLTTQAPCGLAGMEAGSELTNKGMGDYGADEGGVVRQGPHQHPGLLGVVFWPVGGLERVR